MKRTAKNYALILILLVAATSMACGYIEPLKEKIAGTGDGSAQAVAEGVTPTKTPRPTFTPTPDWTPTPTFTLTPMPTPTPTITPTPQPTDTPTPVPPTATFTPAPPTNTPKPRPPTATFTPAPPTATPTPSFPFKLVEGPSGYPTTNPILVMYIALTDPNNIPIGGLKVVGDHTPSGLHWESGESCWDFCKASGTKGTIKFGNVTFEPPRYETGVWNLRVVDGNGTPVSDVISVPVDAGSPGWFFMLLRRS